MTKLLLWAKSYVAFKYFTLLIFLFNMGRFWEFCSMYISMRDVCKTTQLPKFIEMILKECFVSFPFKYCYFCISKKLSGFLVARQQSVKITFKAVKPLLRMRMLKYEVVYSFSVWQHMLITCMLYLRHLYSLWIKHW